MGDAVGRSKVLLGKVKVMEFNGIGEQQGLGGIVHGMEAEVVVEVGENVETITGTKVPRLARIGFVVDKDFVSKGAKWCGILTVGAVEVPPGGYGRI